RDGDGKGLRGAGVVAAVEGAAVVGEVDTDRGRAVAVRRRLVSQGAAGVDGRRGHKRQPAGGGGHRINQGQPLASFVGGGGRSGLLVGDDAGNGFRIFVFEDGRGVAGVSQPGALAIRRHADGERLGGAGVAAAVEGATVVGEVDVVGGRAVAVG